MEAAAVTYEIVNQTPEVATRHPATRAAMAVNSIAASSRTLELIHRCELRFSRQYNRTLKQIFTLCAMQNKPQNKKKETNPGRY